MASHCLSIRSLFLTFQHRPSSLQAWAISLLMIAAAISVNARIADGVDSSLCGTRNGGKICSTGYCCSAASYCGPPQTHCLAGCDPAFSDPTLCIANSTGSGPNDTSPNCGRQTASNKKCAHNMCCSQFGFCGTDRIDAYCYRSNGCQSQCRYSPGEIGGIVGGTLGGFSFICVIAFGIHKWYRKHQGNKPITKEKIDPVHRLFPVDETFDKGTCLDIVFCHGFAIGKVEKEAWKNTWRTCKEPVVCWAEKWLGEDLKEQARVFSLEYDANMSSDPSKKGHNTDVSDIASNLLQCIFGASSKIGQSNAVVLVGHSFGGLVIKNLVVEAQRLAAHKPRDALARAHAQRCQNFLNNIEGFVFYAVPHSGAQNLENYIHNCDSMLRRKRLLRGYDESPPSLLSNIKAFSRIMEALSVKFESFVRAHGVRNYDLIIYAFTEGLPMTQGDSDVIVEFGSAVRGSENNHYKIETANHMTVCQYSSKKDESYQQLLPLLEMVMENRNLSKQPQSTHLVLTGQVELVDRSLSDLEDQGKQSLLYEGLVKSIPESTSQKLTRISSKLRNSLPRC